MTIYQKFYANKFESHLAREAILDRTNRTSKGFHVSIQHDPTLAIWRQAMNTGREASFGHLKASLLELFVLFCLEQTLNFTFLNYGAATLLAVVHKCRTLNFDVLVESSLNCIDQTFFTENVATVPENDTSVDWNVIIAYWTFRRVHVAC